jgi:hypothetical protein
MAGRKLDQSITLGEKEIFPRYYQRTHPFTDESREGRVFSLGVLAFRRTKCLHEDGRPAHAGLL